MIYLITGISYEVRRMMQIGFILLPMSLNFRKQIQPRMTAIEIRLQMNCSMAWWEGLQCGGNE
jgi:hypothetical protein